MLFGNETETILLSFNFNPEGIVIRDGGQYPKLRNEILMDYYTASTHGVDIGDKVLIAYNKYSEDRLTVEETQEEFVVTGFIDRLSSFNDKDVIMSAEFNDAESEGWDVVGFTLDVPDSEKKAEYEKIDKLFEGQMMSDDELIAAFLGMYDVLFSFLRNMMMIVVTGVLGFLIVMYQTVFMKDEESEIALLMSTGVDENTTKRWQLLRMMILFAAAMVISLLVTPTLISRAMGLLFNTMLGLTGFVFTGGVLLSIIWTIFITLFIAMVMMFVTRKIRNIEIWRVRNE
jgi:ABC-type antimicrobial peptide transport system permease subunit